MSRQSSKVGGWLPPQNILNRHFEKYLHGMVLKLSGHVTNTISLLYKQKPRWNSNIWNFFSKKLDFFSILVYFHWKSTFWVQPCLKHHCDVIRWLIFMILVSMERGDPTLYHGTKQSYFGLVNFKFIGVVKPPLKPCYKKRLGRTRVNDTKVNVSTSSNKDLRKKIPANLMYIINIRP